MSNEPRIMGKEFGKVVTRFAPSPTGLLHSGNYRTAFFSYLYARQNRGKFVLRIEDTDRERFKQEYADNIFESLEWLGLEYDNQGDVPLQSERGEVYKKYLQKLLDENKAYISKEEIKKEGDKSEVIRFRNPNKVVTFRDIIRGDISMDTTDLKDFIIAKSISEPVFHVAVVVDDYEMGVTHIVRGEDHISNTPRQILIMEAIGAPIPYYAHLPLVLAMDRTKLSKRKGALALTEYRDRGYLAEAILNYMALLGWNPGTNEELLFKSEMIEKFDLAKVQKGAAIFDEEKLKWFNREHLKKLSDADFLIRASRFLPVNWSNGKEKILGKIIPRIRERVSTLGEVGELERIGELSYFFDQPKYTKELLRSQEFLVGLIDIISAIGGDDFNAQKIKGAIWDFATEKGRGNVLWPMRVALSGKEKSPDPFTIAEILGKDETLSRLRHAKEL